MVTQNPVRIKTSMAVEAIRLHHRRRHLCETEAEVVSTIVVGALMLEAVAGGKIAEAIAEEEAFEVAEVDSKELAGIE
jgi:hypothetical protein